MISISPVITYAKVAVDYQSLQAKLFKPGYAWFGVSIASTSQKLESMNGLSKQEASLDS